MWKVVSTMKTADQHAVEIIPCSNPRKVQELVELESVCDQWAPFGYMELGGKNSWYNVNMTENRKKEGMQATAQFD